MVIGGELMANNKSRPKVLNLSVKLKAKKQAAKPVGGQSAKKQVVTVAAPAVAAKGAMAAPLDKQQPSKKVSQKLIETIEKRKKAQANQKTSSFGRPMARRGRRPRAAVEYTPVNNEDDTYSVENEYERLEYDTGIRLKEGVEDRGFGVERFDESNDELDFDR